MRLCRRSLLFVLCTTAAILAGNSAVPAQLSDLPLKPGLWETHVIVKAGAMNNDATAKSCFSAGTTLGDYLKALYSGSGVKCSVSNKVQSSHAISYDTACTGPETGSRGHTDLQLNGAESFSGTSHTTVTGATQGRPINVVVDKTFNAKFLGSDCGEVKPMVVPK